MPPNTPETAIRTPDQRLRVFISSTVKELASERTAARGAIAQLRLTPVVFEAGARPHPPRELYRAYLSQSDIFIGIYGREYGWVAPGMEISGLEDELLLAATKPRLIYVRSEAERDPRLDEMLGRIRTEGSVSYHRFSSAEQLRDLIENDLAVFLSERFAVSSSRTTAPDGARRLPAPAAPIIGRGDEIQTLGRLLAGEAPRLITLTGPGGIGKTRLALAVAEREREEPQHGPVGADVAFLEPPLEHLNDPRRVACQHLLSLAPPENTLAFPGQIEEGRQKWSVQDKTHEFRLIGARTPVGNLGAAGAEVNGHNVRHRQTPFRHLISRPVPTW